uniref:Signal transducing adaptor family member 2 n=1 Tax=Marmota marmota marmota TaxID=9994 RepID=A0A8C5ZVJ9_MARMA
MASAPSPPRVPKPKGIQPSHYYESFLEKKGPCDQGYKKFWAGLQGLTISFYSSNRDLQPLEKLDLRAFVKLTDEAPWAGSRDPGIHFSLVLRDQEIKFKVESLESREMWKGFILTVVELRIPSKLTLLPGHLYMMAEVLAKEEARRSLETPSCFLKVSRLEAQLLLERYPECGNLLLRPSGDGKDGVSVTTRQTLNGYAGRPRGLHWAGGRGACSEGRPSPAPPAGGPKSLPPVASSQDKLPPLPPLPPLPSQDDNYVTPIADAPAADYVNQDGANQDGAWGRVLLGGGRLMAPVTLRICPHSVFLWLSSCPKAQEVSKGSSKASKATHIAQAR